MFNGVLGDPRPAVLDAVASTEGRHTGEDRSDECLVDDDRLRRAGTQIVLVEVASGHDRDAHRREVARIDDARCEALRRRPL